MRVTFVASIAITVLVIVTSCDDPPVEPDVVMVPTYDMGGAAACPTPAKIIVTNEAELTAALASANPGDVIGIDGLVEVTATVTNTADNITVTCATPGSGIISSVGLGVLFINFGDGVLIDGLVFEGGNIPVQNQGDDVQFSNNTVQCGPIVCAFFPTSPNALVVDNEFIAEQAPSFAGLQFQSDYSGARFERNTMVASIPRTDRAPYLASGIRFVSRGNEDVSVEHNVIMGPFNASVAIVSGLRESGIKSNKLEGAYYYGFMMRVSQDNVVRNNQIPGAGTSGVHVDFASCGNVFVGNNLNGNADDVGAIFTEDTGANTLIGNQNVVIDNGRLDCDGDAVIDPNIISGHGAVLNGVKLGEIVSSAVSEYCPGNGAICIEAE